MAILRPCLTSACHMMSVVFQAARVYDQEVDRWLRRLMVVPRLELRQGQVDTKPCGFDLMLNLERNLQILAGPARPTRPNLLFFYPIGEVKGILDRTTQTCPRMWTSRTSLCQKVPLKAKFALIWIKHLCCKSFKKAVCFPIFFLCEKPFCLRWGHGPRHVFPGAPLVWPQQNRCNASPAECWWSAATGPLFEAGAAAFRRACDVEKMAVF